MGMWANGNDNVLRIRLTEAKYADAFMQKGSIKFNTPDAWARYAIEHGDGRGDSYEGTIAFCHYGDIEHLCELQSKYDPQLIPSAIYTEGYQGRILFKNYGSMHLPCFCLYLLRVADLDVPTEAGKQKFKVSIPGSYFKDFTDNKTQAEVLALPEEEQPAMILIKDFNKFQERLKVAVEKIGVENFEILTSYVSYYNFEKYGPFGWYDFGQRYPKELFIKSSRFSNQSEGRIIIKTSDVQMLDRLKKPIELGNMSDIEQVCKGYFPEGIDVELNLDIYAVD